MPIVIEGLLSKGQLETITKEISTDHLWLNGKATASGAAAEVKNNLQLDTKSPSYAKAGHILQEAVRDSHDFQTATWIKQLSLPIFNRYDVGMSYGEHLDTPLIQQPHEQSRALGMRTDIAVTISLNEDYDGGLLMIREDGFNAPWKGQPGDAILYSAGTLHQVTPVERGSRISAVFWVESCIREEEKRKILHELSALSKMTGPESKRTSQVFYNLVRMWT